MSAKVLVVVGMHRSGTSLITQWLNRCGLFIGSNLVGPAIGNLNGHFEDADFLRIHQKLLRKRRLPESGLIFKDLPELSELEKTELKGIIESKNRKHEEWGWKEPRTSLFLGEYNELIPGAFYVVVVRSFNATVNSLVTRQHKMEEKKFHTKKGLSKLKWKLFKRKSLDKIFETETDRYLKVWIHYYEKIFQHIQSLPEGRFMFINYAQLNSNDEDFFAILKNNWHFSLEYMPFKNVYEQDLLSEVRDVTKYVRNKALLTKAIAIEKEISLRTALETA
ncbi:sulfotransferase [Ferruginibacter sp.]